MPRYTGPLRQALSAMRLILITTLLVASISVFAESEAGKAVRGLLSGDYSNIEHVVV